VPRCALRRAGCARVGGEAHDVGDRGRARGDAGVRRRDDGPQRAGAGCPGGGCGSRRRGGRRAPRARARVGGRGRRARAATTEWRAIVDVADESPIVCGTRGLSGLRRARARQRLACRAPALRATRDRAGPAGQRALTRATTVSAGGRDGPGDQAHRVDAVHVRDDERLARGARSSQATRRALPRRRSQAAMPRWRAGLLTPERGDGRAGGEDAEAREKQPLAPEGVVRRRPPAGGLRGQGPRTWGAKWSARSGQLRRRQDVRQLASSTRYRAVLNVFADSFRAKGSRNRAMRRGRAACTIGRSWART
jgi:hypothetical protein